MIPVNQTDSTKERGNCQQACVATLFNLELEQVPNFRLFDDDKWWPEFLDFIWGLGFEVIKYVEDNSEIIPTVNGYVLGTIETGYGVEYGHQVIVDTKGLIIHDPMPNNPCNGKNVITDGTLKYWYLIKKQ